MGEVYLIAFMRERFAMLDFMVISLPRSGSTWAANWLTSGTVFAMHDPLWQMHRREIDAGVRRLTSAEHVGIACTGLFMWPDFVNRHPARKLILHRPLGAVRLSLKRLHLPELPANAGQLLDQVDGWHVPHDHLFSRSQAPLIWHYLTGGKVPFDRDRHERLIEMRIEPKLDRVHRREIDHQ